MNDLQIQYFLSVAEAGSFTAAARRLYVSQPAVSKQVAALEAELGLRLLKRGAQGAALTEAGTLFYGHFSRAAQDFRQTLSKAQRHSPDASMCLHFGAVEDWDVSSFIPQAAASLQARFPALALELSSLDSVQILKKLQSGKLDLILYSPMFLDEKAYTGLTEHFVVQARMIVLFSAAHPLAAKPDLCLSDFAGEPYLLCSRDTNTVLDRVMDLCASCGFTPRMESSEKREDLFLKLQTGRGFTIFHELVRCKTNPAFRYLLPEVPENSGLRQELCLYHRTDNPNPALPIVVQAIKKALFGAKRA